MHRVLEVLRWQVFDLGKTELLALIHVQHAWQGGDEQGSGAGAAHAERQVGRGANALGREGEGRVGRARSG